jgi:hypothetical protein
MEEYQKERYTAAAMTLKQETRYEETFNRLFVKV